MLRLLEDNNFSFFVFEDRRGRLSFVVGGGIEDFGRLPLMRREGGRGDEAVELAEEILVGEVLLSLLIGDFTPIPILGFGEVPRDLFGGRESSGSRPIS